MIPVTTVVVVITADMALHEALAAPDTLPATLQAAGPIPPEVAHDVARAGFAAVDANDFPRAKAAFRAAMLIFSMLNDVPRVVDCGISHAEILKVLATTEDEYGLARDEALTMLEYAHRLRSAVFVFNAAVVAADSAYFAALAAREANNKDAYCRWLLVTLDDCVEALARLENAPDDARRRNLVSLVGVTVREALQNHWSDTEQSQVNQALRRVALATESNVRPGTHTHIGEDPDLMNREMVLAALSYVAGSPDAGRKRLLLVADRAEASGDLAAFVRAASALYAGERDAYRLSDDLTALREKLAGAVDSFRSQLRSRAGRLWMAQQFDELSGQMVTDEFTAVVGRDIDRAYRAVERFKARTLQDEMTGHLRDLPGSVLDQAVRLEAEVLHLEASPALRDLVGDQMRLTSRLPIGGLRPSPELPVALAELESVYTAHDSGFLGTEPLGTIDSIIKGLGEDEAILSYHIPYDPLDPAGTLLILVITSRGAMPIHLPIHQGEGGSGLTMRIQTDGQQPIDASLLGELIINTRLSILGAEDNDAAARLAELYRILLSPVEKRGVAIRDVETLYIVPHGILHAVPFAALRTPEGRFLAEDVATVVVPSVAIWEQLRRRGSSTPTSFLGFANPSLEDYEPLPDAELELDDVKAMLSVLDTLVLVDDAASESALVLEAPGRGIVHFATHGEFPETDVMNMHEVLLSPTADHDGHVHAAELRDLDLRSTELVVLSICDGGVYRFGPGDEPYGLLPALLTAGTRNVLGPQWAIDDTEARLLVTEFYRRLLAEGPARALQGAVVSRLKAGAEIRDWAGFVLFGAGTWVTR